MIFAIDQSICSDLREIKTTLENILEELCQIIHDESLLFDIKLILNELIINSAIHGNNQDKNKNINLHLHVDNRSIKIEITDEGSGFCYDKDSYDPMDLKCCGRGLVLVDGLSDEFYVNKNKVISIKYI
ncbi:ATP-binding protein [Brassicibacter mesophilus]|uniref:ATP-binding protein n=1 Tax=Brassicibacter mesophilus TaxID=745119 RepID=UPI003D1C0682